MPRGRTRKKDTPLVDMNISVGDVTDEIYPEGVPRNDDGSIAVEALVPIEQAREVGAVSPESAQYNKDLARKIKRKAKGETVKWGESEALHLYDAVRQLYPSTMLWIHFQRTEPQPTEDYRPVPSNSLKNGQDLYDHILKNIHTSGGPATYGVRFKESNGQERGRGFIRMPEIKNTSGDAMHDPRYPQYPPPGFPYAYPGFQGPPPYPPQQQAPYPYPPPQQHAPPPAAAAHEPPPPAAPPPQQAPQTHVYMPPLPVAAPAAGMDQAVMNTMASQYQEIQRLQQLVQQNQLQMAQVLGAIEEQNRRAQQQPTQHQAMPQSPWQQPQSAPPPPPQSPWAPASQPSPWGPPPQQPPPAYGFGYGPPPPQQQAPPAPGPVDPLEQIRNATQMLAGITKAVAGIRQAVGSDEGPEESFPEPEAPPAPPPPPFKVMPLGPPGGNAMQLAYNDDGSIHPFGTFLANAGKITDFVKGISDTIQQQAQLEQQQQAQMHEHFQAQARQRAQMQAQAAPPPPAYHQPPYMPPPPAPITMAPSAPNPPAPESAPQPSVNFAGIPGSSL